MNLKDSDPLEELDEFGFIQHKIRALTLNHPGALNLEDDAALLDPLPHSQYVVSTDSCVEDVHFRRWYPPSSIGKRAFRSALSDLAAMGAKPEGVFINLIKPKDLSLQWLEELVWGIEEDVKLFDAPVLGGDTVQTSGPLVLSVTVIGAVKMGRACQRSTAQKGDLIMVTGTIGDSFLGLQELNALVSLQGDFPAVSFVMNRHLHPEPQLKAGILLAPWVTAMMDVSDGLIADLGHIARHSGLTAALRLDHIPLSESGKRYVASQENMEKFQNLASGGEDFELLFTLSHQHESIVRETLEKVGISVTSIGYMEERQEKDVQVSWCGRNINCLKTGFVHF